MTDTPFRRALRPLAIRAWPILAAVALTAFAFPTSGRAASYETLSADQVQKLLGAPDVRILDVNTDDVFRQNHLPGAIHVGSRELATLLPADKATRLVFYCTSPG